MAFEARHYEGEYVPLDSILIKNISRNCDTMLYAPDTVLYYNYYVGIEEIKNTKFNTWLYPNPAKNGKSQFDISVYEQGTLNLELLDLRGNKVFGTNKKLKPGNYTFGINFGNEGVFVLLANYKGQLQSHKIIVEQQLGNDKYGIEQKTFSPLSNSFKTMKTQSGFWYEPGDTLWYVGYALSPNGVAGSDVLEDVPDIFSFKRFSIVEGLPCEGIEAVKYGGQLYPTVEIFGNCWFKENLNIGEMIVGDSNMADNGTIEKYCYDNDTLNCQEYGGLYQWNELMDYSEHEATQGICPDGWHIPTSDEYLTLIEDFDGEGCKERGNGHWKLGFNVNGTNTKGFTALGAGYRQIDSCFYQISENVPFFSSTKMTYDWIWYIEFNKNNLIIYGTGRKEGGLAVRCTKD